MLQRCVTVQIVGTRHTQLHARARCVCNTRLSTTGTTATVSYLLNVLSPLRQMPGTCCGRQLLTASLVFLFKRVHEAVRLLTMSSWCVELLNLMSQDTGRTRDAEGTFGRFSKTDWEVWVNCIMCCWQFTMQIKKCELVRRAAHTHTHTGAFETLTKFWFGGLKGRHHLAHTDQHGGTVTVWTCVVQNQVVGGDDWVKMDRSRVHWRAFVGTAMILRVLTWTQQAQWVVSSVTRKQRKRDFWNTLYTQRPTTAALRFVAAVDLDSVALRPSSWMVPLHVTHRAAVCCVVTHCSVWNVLPVSC
jgi:hypothetical protein